MKTTLLGLGAALTFFALPASAADWSGICKPDIEKYCQGIPAGQGRILACLQGNRDRISPACNKAGKWWKKQIKDYAQACLADQLRVCKGVKPGWGRIEKCMKANTDKLSKKCRNQRAKNEARLKSFGPDCKADLKKHCKKVKWGWGRQIQCLESHRSQLAPKCAAHFSDVK